MGPHFLVSKMNWPHASSATGELCMQLNFQKARVVVNVNLPYQPYLWSKASLGEGHVFKHCASYNGLIYPVVKFSHVDYSFTQRERESAWLAWTYHRVENLEQVVHLLTIFSAGLQPWSNKVAHSFVTPIISIQGTLTEGEGSIRLTSSSLR